MLAGIPLEGIADCVTGDLLVCVTEKRTAAEIENFGLLLEEFMSDANGGKEVSA